MVNESHSIPAVSANMKSVEILKRHEPIAVVLGAFDIDALERQIRAETEWWSVMATESYPDQMRDVLKAQRTVETRNEAVANRLLWLLKPLAVGPLAEAIASRDKAIRQFTEKQETTPIDENLQCQLD
ncbi:hypothetical protein [Pseudomonas amygdali]|uniref:hypothetical protein n=1 Tax=Pseudomonas amygdali TaxID=47877 RepID=UPI0006E6A4C9|nr:hypothetical protein [Pseudomonas amygdali]KPY54172.1 hypothetical protein ALO93_102903 [Pseudomonas amygdali pv. sesami]RMT98678.1 hypothetical protein ALP37_102744 [Pseudomonas amygdali pv. sesami]